VEPSEYDRLDRAEDGMWWFAALHANLLAVAHRSAPGGRLPFLDAGCGTGGLLARLADCFPERMLVGLDLEPRACARAAGKSGRPVCAGSVDALPFADGTFAAIFSADVLCHRRVDETRALEQFRRCLVEGGRLVLNLPAYRWMLSRHDAAVHNARRYTIGGLDRLLRRAGFRLLHATYWNTILFPLMVATRKLAPQGGAASDVALYPRPVDALCRAATSLETRLLRVGLRLPFGGSLVAVAAKRGAADE
jgi:SAM-dependent methyltransferase